MKRYTIDVTYYPEDECLVGTSEDIPGLVLEADSIKEFVREAKEMVPYLLEANLGLSENDEVEVFIALKADNKLSTAKEANTTFCFSDEFIGSIVQEANAIPVC